MSTDPIEAAETAFRSAFDRDPAGVWSAPGRVSYGGDHTAGQDGVSLGFAVGPRIAIALAPREDDRIIILNATAGEHAETTLTEMHPGSGPEWSDYPFSMMQAMLDARPDAPGVTGLDACIASELPIGGGLASTAALCAATGLAVNEAWSLGLDLMQIALLGPDAERRAGRPLSGEADHVTVLFAQEGKEVFYDARGQDVAIIEMQQAEGLAGLLVDTGDPHPGWVERGLELQESTAHAASILGVQKLRELRPAELDERWQELDETSFRRARHVVSEIHRTLEVTKLLRTQGAATIGPLLQASQDSLREDCEVTTPRVDFTVELALSCGAIAARASGTGFGGTVFVIMPRELTQDFAAQLAEAYREQGWGEPGITAVWSHEGARRDR